MNFTVFMVLSEVATDGRDLKNRRVGWALPPQPLLTMSLILESSPWRACRLPSGSPASCSFLLRP